MSTPMMQAAAKLKELPQKNAGFFPSLTCLSCFSDGEDGSSFWPWSSNATVETPQTEAPSTGQAAACESVAVDQAEAGLTKALDETVQSQKGQSQASGGVQE